MTEQVDQAEMQKMEEMKKVLLRKILSKPAMERLSTVKLARPEVAQQLEMYLVRLYQSGKIKSEVSEEQMKMILETISGTASADKFRIVRK
jgi:programmed cell death protein 5